MKTTFSGGFSLFSSRKTRSPSCFSALHNCWPQRMPTSSILPERPMRCQPAQAPTIDGVQPPDRASGLSERANAAPSSRPEPHH